MKSKIYRHKKTKRFVGIEQMAIRGFVREFKSKLLAGKTFSQNKPEFSLVDYEFSKQLAENFFNNSNLRTNEQYASNQESHLDSSVFSKWWSGQRYPNPQDRDLIDILFPGLTAKWLDRSNFKNRMQVHLASLDLFDRLRSCNSLIHKSVSGKSQPHCDKCFPHVLTEAQWMLEAIHDDWKPVLTGYLRAIDVCISGPQSRSGFNVSKSLLEKVIDHRGRLDYDLSLGESSFVGLPLPEEIVNSYQSENPFSIVLFLFLLICLDFKTESEYRNDLVLDFMTALNCAGVLLYFKQAGLFTSLPDSFEEKFQEILLHASEYFYDQPFDLNEQLFSFEKSCEASIKDGLHSSDSIVYPFTHFSDHAGFNLSELFFNILQLVLKEQDIHSFMEDIRDHSHAKTYDKKKVDDYLAQPYLQIFKALESARERYLKHFDIIGYSRNELITELSNFASCPVNTRIGLSADLKKSPLYYGK